jgi:hypothetical protein
MATFFRIAGLVVVLAAAAVLSFAALRDLAIAVRVHEHLAFLLPIAVDAGAAVSCTVWLSPAVQRDARRFACWLTWLLLGATVIGNAAQQGMHAHGVTPPWWVAVLVGAVPPAVVGGVVHLLVLVNRAEAPDPVDDEPEVEELPQLDERGLSLHWQTAPQAELPPAQPRQRISSGTRRNRSPFLENPPPKAIELAQRGDLGKVRLQKAISHQLQIDISEHEAKELLNRYRPNGQVTT